MKMINLVPLTIVVIAFGSDIKASISILNCVLARQLCSTDQSCSAILEIIPRVCGPVPVACSTVTVTKCQAALKTLQAFPFFRPTCLCKEPGVDPDCNNFRDFLFDHPCSIVLKKEKDPYPVDALPTCNHALSVCQTEQKCLKLFENFKIHCKVRDNKCKMDNRDLCHDAWINLRLSPMFGCICPNNYMKRRCDRIFSMVNHNPCIGHQEQDSEQYKGIVRIHFQSTCHIALNACRDDELCSKAFQEVLVQCDLIRCNRNSCMDALQSFYRASHEDLSLDAAFCLCKKTGNRHDTCLIAQEKLHPVCAQRSPDNGVIYHPPLGCHAIADECKEDENCRTRLENYEQSCAVDSVTRKCASRPSSCRSAILGILGTPLRISCSCQGTDIQQLHECHGWHQLLWLNPCVVESQKDFHMKRLAELGLLTTSSTLLTSTKSDYTVAKNASETHTTLRFIYHETSRHPETYIIEVPKPNTPYQMNASLTESSIDYNYIEPPAAKPDILLYNVTFNESKGHTSEEHLFLIPNDTTEQEVFSTITTAIPTTSAPRYCIVQRPQQTDQIIFEGSTKRIHSLEDLECSELCSCADTLTLTCHALCVPYIPCRSTLAYYSHASPAYQAYRGRCICYSGHFICMRPAPGDYILPGGSFLLLGYSSVDEAALRPYTNLGIQDAIRELQQYIMGEINNQTSCVLTLFNMTDENIIVTARLPQELKLNQMDILNKEKIIPNKILEHSPPLVIIQNESRTTTNGNEQKITAQCSSLLERISQKVNDQHSDIASHRLLSIFKMAEVQIIWPEVSAARINHLQITIYILLVFLIFNIGP